MSRGRPRGLVTKRGSRWTVILSDIDPATGERRRHYHAGYLTRREAEKARTALLSQMDDGTHVPPEHALTVAQFLTKKWLPEVREQVRPSTYESYRLHVENYLVPRIGGLKIQTLKPDHLNKAYRELRKHGGRNSRSLSDRTVELTHVTIRHALKDAQRWGYVNRNVADAANRPRVKRRKEMNTWTAVQLRQFLAYVDENDPRRYPLWLLASSTGARRGELLGARWRDLDFANSRLSIRQTVLAVRNKIEFSQPKTEKGRRNVALDNVTLKTLRTHRRAQAEEKLLAGPGYEDLDLIFATEQGGPLHPDQVSKSFKRLARRAGVPVIPLHSLRHSHATLALQAGIHPKVISERLGHANITLTLNTYSHAIPSMQEEAAEQIASLVFGS